MDQEMSPGMGHWQAKWVLKSNFFSFKQFCSLALEFTSAILFLCFGVDGENLLCKILFVQIFVTMRVLLYFFRCPSCLYAQFYDHHHQQHHYYHYHCHFLIVKKNHHSESEV